MLALIVLGVASLLMIFFVLPRISNDGKPIGDAINEAGNAVKNSVEMGADKAGDILSDAAEETANIADKVGRLAASATQSIKDLTTLFADSKVPSDADFAAARKKVETSLKELTNIEIPESLDETTSRLITTARTAAERTTAFLRGLPDNAAAAAAQVRRLAGVFAGTDDGAPEPAKPAAAPADAAQSSAATPTFDVLRVEPDGSAVIAGKAQPGAKLEILSNGKVVAQTTIDGTGDFAAVFDNPLPRAITSWCCVRPMPAARRRNPKKWQRFPCLTARRASFWPWFPSPARQAACWPCRRRLLRRFSRKPRRRSSLRQHLSPAPTPLPHRSPVLRFRPLRPR